MALMIYNLLFWLSQFFQSYRRLIDRKIRRKSYENVTTLYFSAVQIS